MSPKLEEKRTKRTFTKASAQTWQKIGNRLFSIVDGKPVSGFVVTRKDSKQVWMNGHVLEFKLRSDEKEFRDALSSANHLDEHNLVAKMPGKVLKVNVTVGETVTAGKTLIVLEAMKMENHLQLPQDVKVKTVHVQAGQVVEAGAILVEFL